MATKLCSCLLLLAAVVLQACVQRVDSKCFPFHELGLPEPEGLLNAHGCPRATTLWKRCLLLWAPIRVDVDCSSAAFKVLTAPTPEALAGPDASPRLWCGWRNLLSEPASCRFELSPLQHTYLAVKPSDGRLFSLGGQRQLECTVAAQTHSSPRRLYWALATLVGVAVFLWADALTSSVYFRIGSGTLIFMSGFVLVLLFSMMRTMPYKRSVSAALLISTSSAAALVRWLFGTWWPGIRPLLHSRLALGYLGVTGVTGLAVSYWCDDPSNVKLMNTIRVALQLAGLATVYGTIADEQAAIGAVLALVCAPWALAALTPLVRAVSWLASRVSGSRRAAAAAAATPGGRRQQQQRGRRSAGADGVSLVCSEDGYQEESGLLDASDSEEEPSDEPSEDEEAAAAAAGAGGGWRGMWPWASAAAPADIRGTQRTPAAAGLRKRGVRILAFKTPPPLSPAQPRPSSGNAGGTGGGWVPRSTVDISKRGAAVQQQQQQQQEEEDEQAWGSAGRWGATQRVALDLANRRTPPSAAAAAAAAASPLPSPSKVVNPDTGREISVGGPKFNELLSRGYTVDWANRTLVGPRAGAGSSGSGGTVTPGSRAVPRLSPAANLRQRTPSGRG